MAVIKVRNDADDAWVTLTGAADPAAIHDNVVGEINAITAKTTPVAADEMLIEDSAASWAKKKVGLDDLWSNAPAHYTDDVLLTSLFMARMSSNMTNITKDILTSVEFDTEMWTDVGSDYDTATYTHTAPVDGWYHYNCKLYCLAIDIDATYTRFEFTTSNLGYFWDCDFEFSSDPTWYTLQRSIIAYMDANDTCVVKIKQIGGTTQLDIEGNYSSQWQGYLIGDDT
jgi:hypothetical protein